MLYHLQIQIILLPLYCHQGETTTRKIMNTNTITNNNTMSTFAITYLWNKKEFTSEHNGNSVEEAIESFKSAFYSCNQVRVEVISAQEIMSSTTNTMQTELTKEEMESSIISIPAVETTNHVIIINEFEKRKLQKQMNPRELCKYLPYYKPRNIKVYDLIKE